MRKVVWLSVISCCAFCDVSYTMVTGAPQIQNVQTQTNGQNPALSNPNSQNAPGSSSTNTIVGSNASIQGTIPTQNTYQSGNNLQNAPQSAGNQTLVELTPPEFNDNNYVKNFDAWQTNKKQFEECPGVQELVTPQVIKAILTIDPVQPNESPNAIESIDLNNTKDPNYKTPYIDDSEETTIKTYIEKIQGYQKAINQKIIDLCGTTGATRLKDHTIEQFQTALNYFKFLVIPPEFKQYVALVTKLHELRQKQDVINYRMHKMAIKRVTRPNLTLPTKDTLAYIEGDNKHGGAKQYIDLLTQKARAIQENQTQTAEELDQQINQLLKDSSNARTCRDAINDAHKCTQTPDVQEYIQTKREISNLIIPATNENRVLRCLISAFSIIAELCPNNTSDTSDNYLSPDELQYLKARRSAVMTFLTALLNIQSIIDKQQSFASYATLLKNDYELRENQEFEKIREKADLSQNPPSPQQDRDANPALNQPQTLNQNPSAVQGLQNPNGTNPTLNPTPNTVQSLQNPNQAQTLNQTPNTVQSLQNPNQAQTLNPTPNAVQGLQNPNGTNPTLNPTPNTVQSLQNPNQAQTLNPTPNAVQGLQNPNGINPTLNPTPNAVQSLQNPNQALNPAQNVVQNPIPGQMTNNQQQRNVFSFIEPISQPQLLNISKCRNRTNKLKVRFAHKPKTGEIKLALAKNTKSSKKAKHSRSRNTLTKPKNKTKANDDKKSSHPLSSQKAKSGRNDIKLATKANNETAKSNNKKLATKDVQAKTTTNSKPALLTTNAQNTSKKTKPIKATKVKANLSSKHVLHSNRLDIKPDVNINTNGNIGLLLANTVVTAQITDTPKIKDNNVSKNLDIKTKAKANKPVTPKLAANKNTKSSKHSKSKKVILTANINKKAKNNTTVTTNLAFESISKKSTVKNNKPKLLANNINLPIANKISEPNHSKEQKSRGNAYEEARIISVETFSSKTDLGSNKKQTSVKSQDAVFAANNDINDIIDEPIIDGNKLNTSSITINKDIKLAEDVSKTLNKQLQDDTPKLLAKTDVTKTIDVKSSDDNILLSQSDTSTKNVISSTIQEEFAVSEQNVEDMVASAAQTRESSPEVKETLDQVYNNRKAYDLIKAPRKVQQSNIQTNKFRAELNYYKELFSKKA